MATAAGANDQPVIVRGLKLNTRRQVGSAGAPPLLLLHGLGGSVNSWRPLLAALPGRDIIMVDAPGVGRSELPLLPLGLPAMADYFADAVRKLRIDPCVDVLGYSLGGMVAQELARRHPALLRRMVLVSTAMGLNGVPPDASVMRALMLPRRYDGAAGTDDNVQLLAGGRTARDPAIRAGIVADRVPNPPSRLGYLYQQWATLGWSSRRWLPELVLPSLVLHGDQDPVAPVANARLLAERLPNAELKIVPGAGHMLLFDEPEKAVAIIEPFLAA